MQVGQGKKSRWIYALQPKGRLYRLRSLISLVYLILFFTLPFIRIKGIPLFLFEFHKATFIFFGKVFLPQDFVMFGLGMVIAILFIIIFTLAFGRVFCGWACPQTIFMEMVFRKIEYWIEGPANKQRLADQKTWTTEIYIRKVAKHIVFFLFSFLIANTFLAYIIGVDELFKIITGNIQEHWGGFFAIVAFTLVFYAVYAFVREIVCTVICPYGRLQSVLLDKSSLMVAYDYLRGEPRSKRRRIEVETDRGDCIDCGLCVSVCPTGIDIRDGIQLECINCTACIDACNAMMQKVQKAPNLIKIASEEGLKAGVKIKFTNKLRFYIATLGVLVVALGVMIYTRSRFDATVLRVPGQILQENADGTVSNLYRIKVVSKSMRTEPYHLELANTAARIEYVGKPLDSLQSGITAEETFFIKISQKDITSRKQKLTIKLMSGTEEIQSKVVSFIGQY